MANPRQRRKARSSSHRPVRHSSNAKRNLKKTPPIRGLKVLQEVWDKRKTVHQNYAAIGLLHTLNPCPSGGVEISQEKSIVLDPQPEQPRLLPEVTESHKQNIPQGFGRIIRDDTGQVVQIEINEGPAMLSDDQEMDIEQIDPAVDTEVLSRWSMGGRLSHESGHKRSSITEGSRRPALSRPLTTMSAHYRPTALEQLSTPQTASNTLSFAVSGVGARHSSTGEISYLQELIDKHGDNIDRMARDRRLNPEQRTGNQLRKALRRAGLCG